MYLHTRDGDAVSIDPPAGDQFLSENGSDWLWAVFAVFSLLFLIFFGLTWRARAGEKILHYLFAIALLSGMIAYFAMASNLGWSPMSQANNTKSLGLTRQIFFPKYVYWTVSFPIIITALGLLSGVSWATILYNIAISWIWVLSYLFSAYTETNYKWGFFAIGTAAYLALAFSTLFQGYHGALRVGYGKDHTYLAGWTNLLWFFYPIAFGLSDGGNKISVTASLIFFGILDLLMIPLLSLGFIILARNWNYQRLNLNFTQRGRAPVATNTFDSKSPPPGSAIPGNSANQHPAATAVA